MTPNLTKTIIFRMREDDISSKSFPERTMLQMCICRTFHGCHAFALERKPKALTTISDLPGCVVQKKRISSKQLSRDWKRNGKFDNVVKCIGPIEKVTYIRTHIGKTSKTLSDKTRQCNTSNDIISKHEIGICLECAVTNLWF